MANWSWLGVVGRATVLTTCARVKSQATFPDDLGDSQFEGRTPPQGEGNRTCLSPF